MWPPYSFSSSYALALVTVGTKPRKTICIRQFLNILNNSQYSYTAPLPSIQIVAAVSESNNITNGDSCPPWFVFSNTSAGKRCPRCECKENFGDVVICDEKLQESYLHLDNCMTYNNSSSDEEGSDAISFGSCPYVYSSNIVNNRYIALRHNISDLNNFFCAPLNRRGLLCRESEFVPATVFYFAVLTLRIRITSAPMNCFVMFSQLVVIALNHSPGFHGALMAEPDVPSCVMFKVILTWYGFWNLDYFHYLIPPFGVSQGLKNIHVLALKYVSAFYPLLLIAITSACVELHDFRPIVWLYMETISQMLCQCLPHLFFCLTLCF